MKTLLAAGMVVAGVVGLMAQSASNPAPAGNDSILTWDHDTNATFYTVYRQLPSLTNWVSVGITTTNRFNLSVALPQANGVYALAVTAGNPAGESGLSTNLWVRYWFNKPTPPKGLEVK